MSSLLSRLRPVLRFERFKRYHYDVPGYGVLVWDIIRAKQAVARGETVARLPVPPPEMENIMRRCDWDAQHLAHVDITQPGIAAPFRWQGQTIYVPIDGIHRVVRAYREGKGMEMDLLTDEASRACLLSGPRELIP